MRVVVPAVVAIVMLPLEAFAQAPASSVTPAQSAAAPSAPATTQAAPAASAPGAVAPASASTPTPPSGSSDAERADTTYQIGARLGFAAPFGDVANLVGGVAALWIEAGYHLSRQIVVGPYARIGPVFTTGSCIGSCNGYELGVGGEAHYTLSPILGLDPWVGVGAGFESMSFEGISVSGFELFSAQAGFDYRAGFGPFVGFAVDQYSSNGHSTTAEWLGAGVRGTYEW